MRMASATTARSGPTVDAMRVTSWLPTKVLGTKASRRALCLVRVQSSSKKLRSFRLDQTAFHNSYCVTESAVDAATNAG